MSVSPVRRDDEIGPQKRLAVHVELSKDRGDIWLGFYGLMGSISLFDFLVIIDHPWQYDQKLEEYAAYLSGSLV